MAKKIWINETQAIDISDDRTLLSREVASRSRSLDWFGLYAFLPDPDPVLQKIGQDISVYRQLLSDAHVGSCYINRKSATLAREWDIKEPAGNLKKMNRQVMLLAEQALNRIDVYQVITDILDAPFYGMSPIEVMWESTGGKWIPTDVVGRPPEWFQFDVENRLKFKSRDNMIEGEPIPDYKFLLPRHHSSYYNPYGDRVMARCFWPVVFKKGGFKYWAIFTEKYGMPWVVGRVPRSTNETERAALLTRLASMVQDACAVINDDESVELKESGGKTASADVYEKLIEAANKECSKAIMGQTATTEGTPGRLGGEDAQVDVRNDLAGQDQRMVASALNQLLRWITDLNFGSETAAPEFGWHEEEDVQMDLAERDKTLTDQGLRLSKTYYQRRYNLEEDEFELTGPTPSSDPMQRQSAGNLFAEGDLAERLAVSGQDRLDRLADRAIAEVAPVFEGYSKALKKWIDDAESFAVAEKRLIPLFDALDDGPMVIQMTRILMDADRLGKESAGASPDFAEAKWGPGKPFAEALDYFRARAVTVSGITKADLLAEIQAELVRAQTEGESLEGFRNKFDETLSRHGFEPMHPWRIETIYRTNLQSAFQFGRYRQMTDPAVLAYRPYWRYVAVMDGSTRPAHAAMHGKIFPADHAVWDTWYPPNGFNCRCTVTTVSERELRRNGWKVDSEDPTGGLVEPIDPVTGNTMPARLLMPDPDWSGNLAAKDWAPTLDGYSQELKSVLEKAVGPALERLKNAG